MVKRTKSRKVVIQELEAFVGEKSGLVAIRATENLSNDTPKDTGWAAANWIPSVGGSGGGSSAAKGDPGSARASQKAGISEIRSGSKKTRNIFIANNVPYIGRLNAGSSNQAPAGFVESAIARAVASVKGRN